MSSFLHHGQRADPPLLVIVQQHLAQFQQQWPIEVQGHRLGNYSVRIMFTHALPSSVYASVSRAWYSAVSYSVRDMGHVNYRPPRPLPRQYEVVDTVISYESESEFHGQTDSDTLSTLRCKPISTPLR